MELLGIKPTPVTLSGRVFELRPKTARMTAEVLMAARKRAITEYAEMAKLCGIGPEEIKAKLEHYMDLDNAAEIMTLEAVAHMLALRSGITLDEANAIPQSELEREQLVIMDMVIEDDQKKTEN